MFNKLRTKGQKKASIGFIVIKIAIILMVISFFVVMMFVTLKLMGINF